MFYSIKLGLFVTRIRNLQLIFAAQNFGGGYVPPFMHYY
ncbi:unknown [Bacteroides sp. CAG:462]|nr:unknown [Bacteroides sp. CAG:462]